MSAAPPEPRARRLRRALLALAASLVASLVLAEIVLRACNIWPYQRTAAIAHEPIMHVPDATLGWRTLPGHYLTPPYVPGGATVETTILPDGSRATAATAKESGPVVMFVGCSFTFGWAISDRETMAWRIQQDRPDLHVVNRGVNAFGTYQALLLLEELLARGERPARVLYGFIEWHEDRNVAAPHWLAMLDRNAHRGNLAVPYATLDARGALVRHPAARAESWPLQGWLSTVSFLERAYAEWIAGPRVAQKRAVTERVLLEMRDLCARHGIPFAVVFLQGSLPVVRQYARFLHQNGIPFADCVVPIPPALRVPGEGHPNGAVNARWASCVEQKLLGSSS